MNVAIMGYGTVGSGVAEVLKKNHEHIVKKSLQESLDLKCAIFPETRTKSL